MSALTDLQTADSNIQKAVADTAAYLKTLAGTVSGGISAEDAESVVTDLNAQAAALEALATPAVAAAAKS